MFGDLQIPYSDAPRRTRGVRNPLRASMAETDTIKSKRTGQVSVSLDSAGRAAQTYPPNSLSRKSRLSIARTSVPAPAKLTIPDTIAKGEISRSSIYNKTPDARTSRLTWKEKFVKSVLSTQIGQVVSDNLAPHIPRTAVAGFPEDDEFHSRNSYIGATMALWDQMRTNEIAENSLTELGTTIEPDEIPTFTRNDTDILRLPITKRDNYLEPAIPKLTQSHPSVLRPGLKRPIHQPDYGPVVPPKDKIDYRIPIHQSLKAQTYNGPLGFKAHTSATPRELVANLATPETKIDYRIPIQQPLKAETYHGKQTRQRPAPVSQISLPQSPTKQPDETWQTSSLGDVKYWEGYSSHLEGLLLKAAPAIDVTGHYIDKTSTSKASSREHRQQQIFGSYSKNDAEKFKRSSDIYKSGTKPEMAQTYPQGPLRQVPAPIVLGSAKQSPASSAVSKPRSVIKRKPVPGTIPTDAPISSSAAYISRIPRRPPSTQPQFQQHEPNSVNLIGLDSLPEKKSRIRPTAEQRKQIHKKFSETSPDPDNATEQNEQAPLATKLRGRKLPLAQITLNPRARTYALQDKPIAHVQTLDENTMVPNLAFVEDLHRPLQRHSNYQNYPPGLNPTAKTCHQKGYF